MKAVESKQFLPQFSVLKNESPVVSPTLVVPTSSQMAHSVDQIFGVGVQIHAPASWKRSERLDSGGEFHLVRCRPFYRA